MKWVPIDGPRTLNSLRTGIPLALFLVTSATIVLFVGLWKWLPTPFTLTLPIQTSRAVQLKLYYRTADSKFREDWTSVGYADSRSTFKSYKLPIASTNLGGLRLRISPGAVVDFGQLILTHSGKTEIAISPSDIAVVNNSCKMEQLGAITRFRTAPDSDGFDLDLHSSQFPLSDAGVFELGATILLCGLLTALVWLVASQGPALSSRLRLRRISVTACRRIVLGLTVLLVLATILKLSGSSSSIWRFYADGRLPDDHLLLGTAKDVRSDEWMVQTPWILSQAAQEPPFPTTNPNIGDGATTLLVNVPIRHWTTIFRPQFWMFFILDLEHAFAWYWNLKWYVMIVGGFLFFRIVSRADPLATIAGTLLTFFAPYIQWWYSTGAALPETVGMTFVGLWAFHTVLRSRTRRAIWLASLVWLFATENFIFCCYPRFQIPLLYFSVLVVVWFLFVSWPRRRDRGMRWSCLAAVLCLVGVFGWAWYREVASTLHMTAQLEYPGKVFSVGGDFSWGRFFVPFLQFGMTEFHYPAGLVNASNAAGFILLPPFIVILLVTNSRSRRDLLVILMVTFVGAVGYFMLVGVPAAVAKYSGWSLVYSTRGILPVGIASIVCFVRLFACRGRYKIANRWLAFAGTLALAVTAWFCLSMVNRQYEEFISMPMVVATAGYLGVTMVLLFYKQRMLALALVAGPVVAAGALVNPICRGLPGFYRSETFQWFRSFAGKDHTARWLVLGSDARTIYLPYLVKAAGGDVLNGIRCNPDMRLFGVLDPEKKHFDVWNRFAVVSYIANKDDKIGLDLTSGVSYTITLPLKPDLLDRLGVRYILTVDTPGADEIVGFRTLAQQNGLLLRVPGMP